MKTRKNQVAPLVSAIRAENNVAFTDNNARSNASTFSALLDFFGQGGAVRQKDEAYIKSLFWKAYGEDPLYAVKALFYFRDVRGGQGERRLFRTCLADLASKPSVVNHLLPLIPEYGRWDDVLSLLGTPCEDAALELIDGQLAKDIRLSKKDESFSLLAKWLPSVNTSSYLTRQQAYKVRRYLGLTPKQYRKTLSRLRAKLDVVERKMCSNEWGAIDYEAVPSRASLIYKGAFNKHDEARYSRFIKAVEAGEAKINAGTLFPHDIVGKVLNGEDNKTLEVLWKNLPDYLNGSENNAIVVADVSGSMNGLPLSISIGLAMYFAERNKGPFANKFITFSESPSLQDVRGATLFDRVRNLNSAAWTMNTNLQAVFDLILNAATCHGLEQKDLPRTLLIVSDMEFDEATSRNDKTNLEVIRKKFERAGYKMPNLVFWRVNTITNQSPVTVNDRGVCLVSGASPVIVEMVLKNEVSPLKVMLDVLNRERYKAITLPK